MVLGGYISKLMKIHFDTGLKIGMTEFLHLHGDIENNEIQTKPRISKSKKQLNNSIVNDGFREIGDNFISCG